MATDENELGTTYPNQNDEFKSSPPEETVSDYFIVKNPLVLLICCGQYQGGGTNNLPGVHKDLCILFKLFHTFYGWTVKWVENKGKSQILDFMDKQRAEMVTKNKQCKPTPTSHERTPPPFSCPGWIEVTFWRCCLDRAFWRSPLSRPPFSFPVGCVIGGNFSLFSFFFKAFL